MLSATTLSAPQTGCAIINNYEDNTPPRSVPLVHPGHPALIQDNDDAPPIVRRPQTQAQLCTQAESHLINMVIQNYLMPHCSLTIKPHKLHHCYSQATQGLVVRTLSWKCLRHVGNLLPRQKMLFQFWPDGYMLPTQNTRCWYLIVPACAHIKISCPFLRPLTTAHCCRHSHHLQLPPATTHSMAAVAFDGF